jgi:TolB protein
MAQLRGSELTTDAPYQFTHQAGIASHPVFSPDGNWIAYYQVRGNTRRITVISAGGSQPSSITDGLATDTDPARSPDNTSIAFVSDNKGKQRIGIARVGEGEIMGTPRWIEIKDVMPSWPSWSPDGKTIAFLGSQKGHVELSGESDLWTIAADGNSPAKQITQGANGKCIRWD